MSTASSISMVPNKRLEEKVAIITGGASGIGATAVRLFWENGAKVVIADIQDDLGQAIADKLGENVSYIHCDVSNEDDMRNLIDTTVDKHGKLDIMYNNAGVIDGHLSRILDSTKADLDRVLGVNVVGAFLGAKHAARVMIPQRKGCILFTTSACTSIAGLSTHPYAISKYGVWGLARNITPELGQYGIRVNCVSPFGVLDTGMSAYSEEANKALEAMVLQVGNLKGQVLRPEKVAQAAVYLASEEASYVSGLNLVIDGGFSVVNPSFMQALPQ